MIPANILDTVDFISKYDTDKEHPTIWKLGMFDSVVRAKIQDFITTYEADPSNPKNIKARVTINLSERMLDIVRFGLKGIENFMHPQTQKLIQFDTVSVVRFGKNCNIVSDEVLKFIPFEVIEELAGEISKQNKLTEEETKN